MSVCVRGGRRAGTMMCVILGNGSDNHNLINLRKRKEDLVCRDFINVNVEPFKSIMVWRLAGIPP